MPGQSGFSSESLRHQPNDMSSQSDGDGCSHQHPVPEPSAAAGRGTSCEHWDGSTALPLGLVESPGCHLAHVNRAVETL